MRNLILSFLAVYVSLNLYSQPFPVGHKQVTYTDAARSNRSIPCHVYYPGVSAGDNVDAASGSFPLIVFGHGFIMGDPNLYLYLLEGMAAEGYICAFPTTENGSVLPAPNHLEFGKDLAFLNTFIKSENSNSSSFLYNKVASTSAVIGHSMGGKATFLAAGLSSDITTIVTMGAAISNPPIGGSTLNVLGDYAVNVTIPCFVISAEFDCVAPPAANQVLLYDTVASACKYFASITGGGHCYFASQAGSLLGCESGELTCSGNFTISRQEQNQTVLSMVKPWMDYYLKNNSAARQAFIDAITNSTAITYRRSCTDYTGLNNLEDNISFIVENPFSSVLVLHFTETLNEAVTISLQDITGRNVLTTLVDKPSGNFTLETSSFPKGVYLLSISGSASKSVRKLIKIAE